MAKVKYLVLEAEDNWTKEDYRKKLVEDLYKIDNLLYEVNDIFEWCETYNNETKDVNDDFIINTICEEYFSELSYDEFICEFSGWVGNIKEKIEEDKKCKSKIEMIKAKRKKLDDEALELKRKEEAELKYLEDEIRALKPRIESIIKIGKELKKNDFNIDYSLKCGVNIVGYAKAYYGGEIDNIAIGVKKIIYTRPNNDDVFKTDGSFIIYKTVYEGIELDNKSKILLCKDFLNGFDKFEKRVDEYLEKNMK